MSVNKGDKLIVTKDVASFLREGEIVEVVDVDGDMISFVFGDGMHKGLMNFAECVEHFEPYEEKPEEVPSVSSERIEEIMKNSEIVVETIFEKCTIVTCKLPNGFVIVESAACVSPENYDEEVGVEICLEKIENKIWELEGYVLQTKLYEYKEDVDKSLKEIKKVSDATLDDLDECLGTALDCDDCECCDDCVYRI